MVRQAVARSGLRLVFSIAYHWLGEPASPRKRFADRIEESAKGCFLASTAQPLPWWTSTNAALALLLRGRRSILPLALTVASLPLYALNPAYTPSQYAHTSWGRDAGVLTVRRIRQTPDGYLWMSSGIGLVRFDGLRFLTFKAGSVEGLNSNAMQDLVIDRDGSMWIATLGGGLAHYQAGRFHSYRVKDGLPSDDVGSLYRDSSGTLWVGTGAGIVRMVNGRFEKPPVAIPPIIVTAFLEDPHHALWMATLGAGVFRLQNGVLASFTVKDGLPDNRVMSLYLDHSGRIWTAGWKGLTLWNGSRFAADPVVNAVLSGSEVRSCTEDRDGNLWIAASSGVFRVRGKEMASMDRRAGLSNDYAFSLFEDAEGNMWVGTRGGLDRFRDSQIRVFRQPEGPVVADNGGVWTASNRQITQIATNTAHTWHLPLPSGSTPSTLLFKPGAGFLIGFDGGLASRTSEHTNLVSNLSGLDVRSLLRAQDGSIWIGTANRGLLRWVSGGSQRLSETGVRDKFIGTLAEDRTGAIWAGSYLGGGLYRLSGEKVQHFGREEGLPDLEVQTLLVDGKGQLWIGSTDGLSWFQDGRIRTVNSQHGLPADHITAVLDDAYGRLWLASFAGIAAIDKASLTDWAAGRRRNITPILDRSAGGLQAYTAGNFFPNCARTADGHLWFSTADGLVEITPSDPKTSRGPIMRVLTEEVTIDGAVLSGAGQIRIPAGARSIEIRYTALGLADPLSVRFRYRLQGTDKDWIDAGARRTAFYGNLKPTSYTFRVAATTDGERWTDSPPLVLEQLPYFYETNWFILLLSLSLVSLAFFVHRVRLQKAVDRVQAGFEERMDERTRIAEELHDTVVQAISGSTMLVENAAEKIPDSLPVVKGALLRAVDKLDAALTESRAALKGLRGSGFDNNLAKQLSDVATDTPAAGTIFRLATTGESRAVRPGIQYEVLRIASEAITNALKHSGAESVQVELEYVNALRIIVRDDGKGIPEQVLYSGKEGHFGLEGMRGRADRIGASLEISSRAGKGTEVSLMVPSRLAFEAPAPSSSFAARALSRILSLRL